MIWNSGKTSWMAGWSARCGYTHRSIWDRQHSLTRRRKRPGQSCSGHLILLLPKSIPLLILLEIRQHPDDAADHPGDGRDPIPHGLPHTRRIGEFQGVIPERSRPDQNRHPNHDQDAAQELVFLHLVPLPMQRFHAVMPPLLHILCWLSWSSSFFPIIRYIFSNKTSHGLVRTGYNNLSGEV